MDTKIKTLLKLEKNPYYKLSEKDKKFLEDWKLAQVPVKVKKPRKKTTNEVKAEQKETGELLNEAVASFQVPAYTEGS